uniref:F-box domain-containing protein n=1 Tax=Oryza punctata TaxID=4537 RepID=A0A0E0M033_ORYPU
MARRRGRRVDKANCRAPRKAKIIPATATSMDDVPDHLLEDILLRLGPSSACLVRAAYACKRWCRVATAAGFLDAFRELHGAHHHVAGYYHTVDTYYAPALPGGESSVFVPSSSLAGVDSRRFFSLDFLPASDDFSWELADSRGGLLLLSKKRTRTRSGYAAEGFFFTDLIVCEPLTRRYQGILCPADFSGYRCIGVFLLDGGDDVDDGTSIGGGGISVSNFRVLCALYDLHWLNNRHLGVPWACVFTSGSHGGGWRLPKSAVADDIQLTARFNAMSFVGRASGCFYWGIDDDEDGAMLVLDENTTEFSLTTFPDKIRENYHMRTFRIIAGGDGAMRVLRVIGNDLKVFTQLACSGGDGEWVLEKLVRLPEKTRGLPGHEERYFEQNEAMIVAANAAYVLLTPSVEKTWLFSVEMETMTVERQHERNTTESTDLLLYMAKEKASCSTNNSSKAPARSTTKGSTAAGNGRSPPTTLQDIPDKLLELILLRLTSSLWLVRAAATCRRWRRVITQQSFLFAVDRPPHQIMGHYHHRLHPPSFSTPKPKCCSVAFVPTSPELLTTGRRSRRFSLDFLPGGGGRTRTTRWEVVDSRGSLLLLTKRKKSNWMRRCFPDLVVCEPVTRRHKVIPRMEEMKHHHCVGVFLLDADCTGRLSMSNFKVTCVVYQPYFGVSGDVGTITVCEYIEDVWNWTRHLKPNEDYEPPKLFEWYVVVTHLRTRPGNHLHGRDSLRFLGHAGGFIFWAIKEDEGSLLILDENGIDPHIFRTPPAGVRGSELRAIVDGNGDPHNVRVVVLEGETLRVVTWLCDIDELVLDKSLHLVEATRGLQGYKEGCFCSGVDVVTVSTSCAVVTPVEEKTTWMVSVDLETMEVAECKYASVAYPCELPWPPTLGACPTRRRGRRGGKLNKARRKPVEPPKVVDGGTTTTLEDVSDHLLEDILLRLGSSACLVRAAYACKRWRRVVTAAGFLDAFRSLHGASHHVAGQYHTVDDAYYRQAAGGFPDGGTNFVFVPSDSLADTDGRRFSSLDFLPECESGYTWELADSRGGLLLLTKMKQHTGGRSAERRHCFFFTDLIVCEPLTRRYQGILCPPDLSGYQCLGVFLLDGNGGGIGMSNFKVICALYDRYTLNYILPLGETLACTFTSGSGGGGGGWRLPHSTAAGGDVILQRVRLDATSFVGRANGRIFWEIEGDEDGDMLVLDETTAGFSLVTFPENVRENYDKRTFRIIAGDDDGVAAMRVVRVINNDLKVFAQLDGDGEWVLEKRVWLPEAAGSLPGYDEGYFQEENEEAVIVEANAAYVLLMPPVEDIWLFSVELETMTVEQRHERNKYAGVAYPCELPWPRALQATDTAQISGRRRC